LIFIQDEILSENEKDGSSIEPAVLHFASLQISCR
jgi:hypothetical protein